MYLHILYTVIVKSWLYTPTKKTLIKTNTSQYICTEKTLCSFLCIISCLKINFAAHWRGPISILRTTAQHMSNMVSTRISPTDYFLSKYIFHHVWQVDVYFSLCTPSVDDLLITTWAPSSVRQHEHQAQTNIILCGPETHFNKPVLLLAVAGGNYTQSPSSGSLFGNSKHDYPQSFPPPLKTIYELICWVDWCWPPSLLAINQSGEIQRRNSIFCEPSQTSLTPRQSSPGLRTV